MNRCPVCSGAFHREEDRLACINCGRRFDVRVEPVPTEIPGKRRKRNEPVAKGKKRCRICQKVKHRGAFYAHPTHADGRFGTCKECIKERQRNQYKGQGDAA